jgi:hypothetical protein
MGPPDKKRGRPASQQRALADTQESKASSATLSPNALVGQGRPPPERRDGPEGPPQDVAAAGQANTTRIVPDRDVHRRRQIQRLATIALVRSLYGPQADLVSPPGPAVCPADCPWCPPPPRPDQPFHMALLTAGAA